MEKLYDYPKYYELAFSWRDIPAEVDLFEECFKRFSRIPVKSVLEVACGNSPHLAELVKRGYRYTGLDLSQAMLDYTREKAAALGASVSLVRGDQARFTLPEQVDFAYVMLGSFFMPDSAAVASHFDSIAAALRPGGLYLLDWVISTGTGEAGADTWEVEKDGIGIKATCTGEGIDPIKQTARGVETLEVDDHGKKLVIRDECVKRVIYPQEFLHFIECHPAFEFVGWWNDWDLDQPLEGTQKIARPITVIRRV